MFDEIKEINSKPKPFEFYTANELWTNEHTANVMLEYHLSEDIDLSSRNKAFIDRSAKWITEYFNIDENCSIADFGCGPGLYTTRFAQKGASVTGIDFSKNSLNYAQQVAKENSLKINYVNTNYLDFQTSEKFDLITMIMCDFCALSPEQRKTLLQKFSSLLKQNGSLLLDVYSIKSFNKKQESAFYEHNHLNNFWSSEEYYCFVNLFIYEIEKVSLDKYTIIEKNKKRIVYNWLQYFSKETLKNELESNGFVVNEFFANVAGDKYESNLLEFAITAKKYNNTKF
ncbi:MAG: class I SAM-dependent methyltransferase [Okeania sp. SIO2D1]|nr:class I SAM-dependent methyltransferase [Okeania sp. SIO2D1]